MIHYSNCQCKEQIKAELPGVFWFDLESFCCPFPPWPVYQQGFLKSTSPFKQLVAELAFEESCLLKDFSDVSLIRGAFLLMEWL